MIEHHLDTNNAVLYVRPQGALQQEDFERLAQAIDPFIALHGALAGLLVETSHFPGWENFGTMIRHFRFVRDHHRQIRRVALVTDSPVGELAEHIASHFVAAEVRHFPAEEHDAASAWLMTKAGD
jgi:SpoIIAA-like